MILYDIMIPYYMIHIIYKAAKLSHSKKLEILQNINNLSGER